MTPRLSSYWLILLTPVPFSIAGPLVDGLRSIPSFDAAVAESNFPDI